MTKPNVIVIYPDQLRAQSLPLFGEHQIETPHIDRLASEGLSIDNAISNCPVCTPARAMLVTGRYPQTTGHLINTTRTRHSEISIGLLRIGGTRRVGSASGIFIRGYGLRLIECLSTQIGYQRDEIAWALITGEHTINTWSISMVLSTKTTGITSVGTAMRPKDCSNMVLNSWIPLSISLFSWFYLLTNLTLLPLSLPLGVSMLSLIHI